MTDEYLERKPLQERFWAKVDRRGPDECWQWLSGSRGGRGQIKHGKIHVRGKMKAAHHVAWYIAHGSWPRYVCHTCDNSLCVNPAHLYEGSPLQNVRDAQVRRRGLGNPKVTPDAVVAMREMYARGMSTRSISAEVGLTPAAVWHCVAPSGRSWRWV